MAGSPIQLNKQVKKRSVAVGVGGNKEGRGGQGWTKFKKEGRRQCRGVFIK